MASGMVPKRSGWAWRSTRYIVEAAIIVVPARITRLPSSARRSVEIASRSERIAVEWRTSLRKRMARNTNKKRRSTDKNSATQKGSTASKSINPSKPNAKRKRARAEDKWLGGAFSAATQSRNRYSTVNMISDEIS